MTVVAGAGGGGIGAGGAFVFTAFSSSAIRALWASIVFFISSTMALSWLNDSSVWALTDGAISRAESVTASARRQVTPGPALGLIFLMSGIRRFPVVWTLRGLVRSDVFIIGSGFGDCGFPGAFESVFV